MNQTFEPRNDLEQKLLAAQDGLLDIDGFMAALLVAQLFLPVYDDSGIQNFQRSTRVQPLMLDADDGTKVLVVFTSPDRAKQFVKDHPGYEGGILTELTWILQNVGVGYGIALNPGWDVGLDLEPQMVAQLARRRDASAG